jgi:DNA-binding transcriptional regulator PaaX
MSKYPDLGILDAIYRLSFGSGLKIPRERVYVDVAKRNNLDKIWFSKKVDYLKRRGFLRYGPSRKLILTRKGIKRLDLYRLENIKLGQKSRDGYLRVIIFDISEKRRSVRDLLRAKLNELECYQLQKSVYVTPYKCEKELEEIFSILGLGGCAHIILAKSIGASEAKIRKHFKI